MLKHDETSRQGARGPPTPSSESQQTRPNLPIRAHLSVRLPSSSRAPRLLPCKAGSPQTTLYFHPYVTVTSMCRVQQGPISPTALETRREPELRLSHPDALGPQHRMIEKNLCATAVCPLITRPSPFKHRATKRVAFRMAGNEEPSAGIRIKQSKRQQLLRDAGVTQGGIWRILTS